MLKILLLDCSDALKERLLRQGFDVESGTVGRSTNVRKLPSQVYEKNIFFYNPETAPSGTLGANMHKDESPEFDLGHLKETVEDGATFVAFLNPIGTNLV